jgi:hypothetical protein
MIEITERRVARERLIAALGSECASGFIDSSESDFQQSLEWSCGCNARKRGFVDRLWLYEPCTSHGLVAPAEGTHT